MKPIIKDIQNSLRQYATPERKRKIEWFFKTGKGQYGEGDQFIGVSKSRCQENSSGVQRYLLR